MIPAINFDSALIAALVERWRRGTNTFHLPFGEMTITLEDVALLLGLAIDVTSSTPSLLFEKLLGSVPKDLTGGIVLVERVLFSMSQWWLHEFFLLLLFFFFFRMVIMKFKLYNLIKKCSYIDRKKKKKTHTNT